MNINVNLGVRKNAKGRSTYTLRWLDEHDQHQCEAVRTFLGRRKAERVTQLEAQQARAKKQAELNRGEVATSRPRGTPRFGGLIRTYRDERPDIRSPLTLEMHLHTLRRLARFFGDKKKLSDVDERDANAFRGLLRREVGLETEKKELRSARAIYNWALTLRMVERNPFQVLRGLQPSRRERPLPHVSRDDIEAMINAASRKRNADTWIGLLALCRFAGLRRIEALELPWAGYDDDDRGRRHWTGVAWDRLRICLVGHCKGRSGGRIYREVPVCPRLNELLLELYDRAPDGAGTIVNDLRNNYSRDVQLLMDWAGVERFAEPFCPPAALSTPGFLRP